MTLPRTKKELQKARDERSEIADKLRELEQGSPDNIRQIWILRDRLAYWEGKIEGMELAVNEAEG